VSQPAPPFFHRHPPAHELIVFQNADGGTTADDYLDSFWLQGSSQWDALRHFGDRGRFYNGHVEAEVVAGRGPLGIDAFARRGLVTRGVVVDLARELRLDPFEPVGVEVADVEPLLRAPLRGGDVLLLRTGWVEGYLALPPEQRRALGGGIPGSAGIAGPDWPAFLWDNRVAAVAADNPALEPIVPGVGLDHELHKALISRLGMPLGELWLLGPLAADCAADGVHECLLTSAPLNVPGGAGSPPNALAVK
jgi:kynurenine formamidase